jgi:hypothetical protein
MMKGNGKYSRDTQHKSRASTSTAGVGASTDKSVTESMASMSVSSSLPFQPNVPRLCQCGCDPMFIVAIDFTGSYGDPLASREPCTLSSAKNDYEKAISAIVGILSKYDTTRCFRLLDSGRNMMARTGHCFQCEILRKYAV